MFMEYRSIVWSCLVTLTLICSVTFASEGAGIAQSYDRDIGLGADADILFFDDFESGASALKNSGRTIVAGESPLDGALVLASHNQAGTHAPYDTYASIDGVHVAYYRFYTRFEPGYDYGGGVKGPGLSAKAGTGTPGGGAGIRPQGDDKFSARVSFNSMGQPYLYYYHMDMGDWGSNANQNIGTPVSMVPGTWYCLEMMLKANTPGSTDGELRLWIDGELKVQKGGIRFRTTEDLKINWINHSAYFGGSWTSPKDQDRFEDNVAAAKAYIGPFGTSASLPDAPEISAVSITFVGVATHATQVAIGGTTVVPAADGSYSITIAVPEGTTDVCMVTTHSDGSTTTRDITLDSAPAEGG